MDEQEQDEQEEEERFSPKVFVRFPREDKKATFKKRPARARRCLCPFCASPLLSPLRTAGGGNWSCCGDNLLPGCARDSAHA